MCKANIGSASKFLAVLTVLFFLLAACADDDSAGPEVRIGSDDIYESELMAEIYAQVLESAGFTVTRSFGLGTRQQRVPALEEGRIDLVPEYVGSGLGFYDNSQITGDGETNRERLAAILEPKDITVLDITPGEDTNAGFVRPETAEEFNLDSFSDLVAVQDRLVWGLPPDCDQNPLCRGALEEYGVTYPPVLREQFEACDVPMAEALQGGAIDFAWLCSTQPATARFGFVQLTDDLDTQPAENIAPLVRDDFLDGLEDEEEVFALLNDASAQMTTDDLARLGVAITVEERAIDEVAAEWLADVGLT